MIKHTTKFSLYNRVSASGTQTVRMRVTWAGNRYDQFLPISIEPKYWDENGMKVKNSYRPHGDLTACAQANQIISECRELVDKFFCHCEVNEVEAALYYLKEWMDPNKAYLHTAPKLRPFYEIAKDCLSDSAVTKCWSESSIVHRMADINNFQSFMPDAKLGEIDDKTLRSFVEYLFSLGHRNDTVSHKLRTVRFVLRWADKKGYPVQQTAIHFEQKFKGTSSASSEVIYLTWDEMMRLRDFPCKHYRKLGQVRDAFLFCCFSGLRYSDVAALKKADIVDGRIRVITQKTTKALDIELNQYSREILAKYEHMDLNGKALPVTSLHSFNDGLKRIAKMAGIDAPTRQVYFVKNERIETISPKYEIISSHCARRSFVVHALRLGIPAEVIMSWTGHSDYDAMRPYVKIVDELKSSAMAKFDFGENKMTLPDSLKESSEEVPSSTTKVVPASWRRSLAHIKDIKPNQKKQMIAIMDEIANDPTIFQVDIAEKMNLCLSTIHKRMQYLIDNGYLTCSGWGRTTRWEIAGS